MKLKALRNFRWPDVKRGMMLTITMGEIFDGDETQQAEEIYGVLGNLQAACVDEKFIPGEARYLCLHGFSNQKSDGSYQGFVPGQTYTFRQEEACRLMATGYVRPTDETAWTPAKLLSGSVSTAPAKKMFDDLPETKSDESWVRRSLRR